jgi:hypothetical protein
MIDQNVVEFFGHNTNLRVSLAFLVGDVFYEQNAG